MSLSGAADAARYGTDLLRGERVRLRGLHDADVPLLAQWWTDPRIAALQMGVVMPTSEAAARALFTEWSNNRVSGGGVGFSIETLAVEPGLVGHITLFDLVAMRGVATLAIGLGPDHQGHGYGSDAVRVMLRYAFTELGLHRVQLEAMSFNDRGINAYRRAGFVEEGRRRESIVHAGRRYDEVLMGVLAAEWRAAQGEPDGSPA